MAWTVGAGTAGQTVRHRWMLVPVYDGLATVTSIVALCVNRIEWRGRRFKMRSGRQCRSAELILRNLMIERLKIRWQAVGLRGS